MAGGNWKKENRTRLNAPDTASTSQGNLLQKIIANKKNIMVHSAYQKYVLLLYIQKTFSP